MTDFKNAEFPNTLRYFRRLGDFEKTNVMRGKSIFFSDLHLLAGRSTAPRKMLQLKVALNKAQTCILGGDIFDFKWSKLSSFYESLDAAEQWLLELLTAHPDCEFHYILGNHDCHPLFVERLAEMADNLAHLTWTPYHIRRGDSLFLHGDIASAADCSHESLERYRQKYQHEKTISPMWHTAYEAVTWSRLDRLAMKTQSQKRTLNRLADYADYTDNSVGTGLRHVYFGHIHEDLEAREHRGLKFHNGGAAIRNSTFRIIEIKKPCIDG